MTASDEPALPLQLYTKAQAARMLGVSERQIGRWIASGDLVVSRLGPRTIRITLPQLERFLEQRSRPASLAWPSVPRRGSRATRRR
ncbi:MAG: helix-turn-helix domain-containing protein [Candidatus Dormibacteraeota bacterium]|nr:helix-turn-helix domain-containing protein [Candidatus Dormibacteraeota bacterium]